MNEYNKRKFGENYRWHLWNADELLRTLQQPPKFWDDSTIPLLEKRKIRWFVGVEVHDYSLVLATYGIHQDQVYLGPIAQYDTTQEGYEKLSRGLSEFSIYRFLMENSGIYHFQVYWELTERFPRSQVIVMNAYDLAGHIKKTRKSDKADAVKLAQLARYDELLRPSYCPLREHAFVRDLCRLRNHMSEDMVRTKNRIKKLFGMYGFRWAFDFKIHAHVSFLKAFLKSPSALEPFLTEYENSGSIDAGKVRPWKLFDPPKDLRENLLFELNQLAVREVELGLIEARLTQLINETPFFSKQVALLEAVPGLGWLNSVSIILEIGEIHRFRTMGKFVVYCGIGPAGGSSGAPQLGSPEEKIVQKDHPNKKCNPWLKKILTQSGMVNLKEARLGHCSTDITKYAATLPDEKKKRMKTRFKVAAKLARQIYHCLMNNEVFNAQGGKANIIVHQVTTHKKRIQAKIRKLLKKYNQLEQAWDQMFDHLTAMGLDASQLQTLRKKCYIQGETE